MLIPLPGSTTKQVKVFHVPAEPSAPWVPHGLPQLCPGLGSLGLSPYCHFGPEQPPCRPLFLFLASFPKQTSPSLKAFRNRDTFFALSVEGAGGMLQEKGLAFRWKGVWICSSLPRTPSRGLQGKELVCLYVQDQICQIFFQLSAQGNQRPQGYGP